MVLYAYNIFGDGIFKKGVTSFAESIKKLNFYTVEIC